MKTLLPLLALLAVPALAAPPPGRPLPEDEAHGDHFSDALCSVQPVSGSIEVPAPRLSKDPRVAEGWTAGVKRAARDGRARLVAVRRLTDRIQNGTAAIVAATNECEGPVWDRLEALTAAAEGAARKVVADSLRPWLPQGETLAWTAVSVGAEKETSVDGGRYAESCRAPDLDADLYAPDAPALPADARAKLAGIADVARTVSGALRAQKTALESLLPLLQGEDCRETLAAFDALTGAERGQFFAYREKAVAGAVWGDLSWKKTAR